MGLMNLFKNPQSAPTVNLTKNEALNSKISLRKDIVIEEAKRQNVSCDTARIVFALDHSGSMRGMYKDGTVQELLERIFPMAMHFDDNSEMEFYWFDTVSKQLPPVNCDTLDGYVKNVILSDKDHFGGTCYAPVMTEIFNRYVKTEPMNIPTFVIFITDGNNSDKKATKDILTEASKYNIFFKYIGIGNEKFEFLEKLDELHGRFIDNANFISVNDLKNITDKKLYSYLLEEYGDWLLLCRKNGIKVDG